MGVIFGLGLTLAGAARPPIRPRPACAASAPGGASEHGG